MKLSTFVCDKYMHMTQIIKRALSLIVDILLVRNRARPWMEPVLRDLTLTVLPASAVYWAWTMYQNFDTTQVGVFLLGVWTLGIHTSVFIHRAWSHRAWQPGVWLNRYALFMHTLTMTAVPFAWVALHRKHHKYADTAQDPHSPYHHSRLRVLYGHYESPDLDYCKDLLRDPDQIVFRKYYWFINFVWFALVLLIIPQWLLLWCAIVGFHAFKSRCINVIGHTNPGASNSPIFAYLFLNGESWHHNHHDDQKNWRLGRRWYQLDLGNLFIRACVALGLGKARL